MSEMIRVSGKTVEDAITNATIQLGASSDNIIYNVIEKESRGFLGIGAKDAVIEVRKKEEADYEAERIAKRAEEGVRSAAAEAKEDAEDKVKKAKDKIEKKAEKAAGKSLKKAEKAQEKADKKTEKAEKKMEKALAEAAEAQEKAEEVSVKEAEKFAEKVTEAEEKAEERPVRRERVIKPLENPQEAIDKAEGFLTDVYKAMGIEAEISSNYDGEVLNIVMNGDEMGLLIGKRGQTLDSLQYLTSLVVNKGQDSYVRVKLDTENYRERRKATLENLAANIAVKVKKTRKTTYLEPMNPYERRIIHSALQDDPFVTTHSEGEEPDRKVVVTLKKDADLDALERKYGERRRNNRYGRGGRGGRNSGRGRRNYDSENTGSYESGDFAETTEE